MFLAPYLLLVCQVSSQEGIHCFKQAVLNFPGEKFWTEGWGSWARSSGICACVHLGMCKGEVVKMQSELLSEGKAHKMFRRKTNGCGGKPVEGNLHLSALLQPLEPQSLSLTLDCRLYMSFQICRNVWMLLVWNLVRGASSVWSGGRW